MTFSDRFKSVLRKTDLSAENTKENNSAFQSSPTLQEIHLLISEEQKEGGARLEGIEKEIQAIRTALDKSELAAKTQRETHQQALQVLQQDATQELKFLERKLEEDAASWTRQITEREKALEHMTREGESAHLEKKQSFQKQTDNREQALRQAEDELKEYDLKLANERLRWREATQAKDNELLALKQELARRESLLQTELQEQDSQRRAAQELWTTRCRELERQWIEKRKLWENSIKAKEEDRVRAQTTFHERQVTWQLEQERRLQDMTRRQEHAAEKVAAMKDHLLKEKQIWEELTQSREEQVGQLKVHLLLSETEAKTQLEKAQKHLHETLSAAAKQVQSIQQQMQSEQDTWKQTLEQKQSESAKTEEEIRSKLRQIKSNFSERLSGLTSQKNELHEQVRLLEEQYTAARLQHDGRLTQLREEQTTLQVSAAQRVDDIKNRFDNESQSLQNQILLLETQKVTGEKDLETLRPKWQEQLNEGDQALKAVQASLAPQEAELKKQLFAEEESFSRQVEALSSRYRALERDLVKVHENTERAEKEHTAAMEGLQNDTRQKEEELQKRAGEQGERLTKRLNERRTALEAFLVMKTNEAARIQGTLKAKEKERADASLRLAHLPEIFEQTLVEKREAAKRESDLVKAKLTTLQKTLAEAREQSKAILQTKATQLGNLRQTLEMKQRQMASDFHSREQILESERAATEKQLSAAQAEMDRVRAHWQVEIDKKEHQAAELEAELHRQEVANQERLVKQQSSLDEKLAPLNAEREALQSTLSQDLAAHTAQIEALEIQARDCKNAYLLLLENSKAEQTALAASYRQKRAEWKAKIDALRSEQEGVEAAAQKVSSDTDKQLAKLEAQIRQQTITHETRRRDLVSQSSAKALTLQDQVKRLQDELGAAQVTFPKELEDREEAIVHLNQQLSQAEGRHRRLIARFDKASHSLERAAKRKEAALQQTLAKVKETYSGQLSTKEAELASLQAELSSKESERQGELDRLAKQFAEERFQLEKTKDEFTWKLKDHKEVSDRQLAGRQKELQTLETELKRLNAKRDEQVAQRAAAFASEKARCRASLAALQNQLEQDRKSHESAVSAKEKELHQINAQSKNRLKILAVEYEQKVNSWRGTNEALRALIENLKTEWVQAQNHWEIIRKEKTDEVSAIRQEVAEGELRLEKELKALEESNEKERQTLSNQLRHRESEIRQAQDDLNRRIAEKEEEIVQATEAISQKESQAEDEWQRALNEWQTNKLALQEEKQRLENELVQLQRQSEVELRGLQENTVKLKMELAFKETQAVSQRERLKAQIEKDLEPLLGQMERLRSQDEQERQSLEARLKAKEEDIKRVRARLGWRDKRLQDEIKRRQKELDVLQQQVNAETQQFRTHFETERKNLEHMIQERRESLTALQNQETVFKRKTSAEQRETTESLGQQRLELEESVRQLLGQREALNKRFSSLIEGRDVQLVDLQAAMTARDQELENVRQKAKAAAEDLRSRLETVRAAAREAALKPGPKSTNGWTAFEEGIRFYQEKNWVAATKAFEACVRKDPRWGPGHQYLALVFHAQGDDVRAISSAQRAMEYDPNNEQLGSWIAHLQETIQMNRAAS